MGETPQQFEYEGQSYLVSEVQSHEPSVGHLGHEEQWVVTAVPIKPPVEFTLRRDAQGFHVIPEPEPEETP